MHVLNNYFYSQNARMHAKIHGNYVLAVICAGLALALSFDNWILAYFRYDILQVPFYKRFSSVYYGFNVWIYSR